MNILTRFSFVIVLLYLIENAEADNPITIIRDLIQNNLAGAPVIHEITKWDFDPDVAVKRRELFQETHGYRGEKLIEKIGLGIDGLHRERLAEQQVRDQGYLGGRIHHIKYGLNTLQ